MLYHRNAVDWGRWEVMENMLEPNLAMLATRQTKDNWSVLSTQHLSGHKAVSRFDIGSAFPLYVYPSDSKAQGGLFAAKEKQSNLAPEFVEALSARLGLRFDAVAHRGIYLKTDAQIKGGAWNPKDLFCYAYAVFHSSTYRKRYAEFLKIDFPRLPLTSDTKLFFKLANLGEELVWLHLMRESGGHVTSTCPPDSFITVFLHSGSNEVEKLRYENGNVWLNKDQCFSGVDADDWNFHIGGYQVLAKWLKDRKGRTLSFDDIEHYQKIVVAIHETRRLMVEIDAVIPTWPIQ